MRYIKCIIFLLYWNTQEENNALNWFAIYSYFPSVLGSWRSLATLVYKPYKLMHTHTQKRTHSHICLSKSKGSVSTSGGI